MNDQLYSKQLLRLAALAAGAGRLAPCDVSGSASNPICGDRISVTLNLEEGRVTQLAHETQACVVTQASASILGAHLRGEDRQAIEILHQQVSTMLQSGEVPPAPFSDYSALLGVATHSNRHKCVLLPLEAVLEALSEP